MRWCKRRNLNHKIHWMKWPNEHTNPTLLSSSAASARAIMEKQHTTMNSQNPKRGSRSHQRTHARINRTMRGAPSRLWNTRSHVCTHKHTHTHYTHSRMPMVAIRRLQSRSHATETFLISRSRLSYAPPLNTSSRARLADAYKTTRRLCAECIRVHTHTHTQHAQQHQRHKRVRSCVHYTHMRAAPPKEKQQTHVAKRNNNTAKRSKHTCACSLPHMKINVIEHDRTCCWCWWCFWADWRLIERCPSMPDSSFCVSCMFKKVYNR